MLIKCVSGGLTILFLVSSIIFEADAQNSSSSVSVSATPSSALPTPSVTTTLTPSVSIPPTSGVTIQSSTINYGPQETCCYIQTACYQCKNLYKVNSITYCCPNCLGLVLVTDLRCTCYAPNYTDPSTLNCNKSKEVVGGYEPLRPSHYQSGSPAIYTSAILSFCMVAAVAAVFKR